MLIDTATLGRHLDDPAWIVFDCRHDLIDHARGEKVYREGHVPGAYFAPVETALAGKKTGFNGRHPLPGADDFVAFLNRHGADANTRIVAYDDVGGQYAARLWWLCRWMGLTRASVLDGGWSKWRAEGGPSAREVPTPRGHGRVVARLDPAQICMLADVLAATNTSSACIIDARAPERFRGETEPVDRVAGHIPSAINRFFNTNLNPDLTLRPAADLRREFETLLDGRSPGEVIHQCGSGVTACVNLLAMEHAGLTGSKLYPGSWSEWIADPARPIARG